MTKAIHQFGIATFVFSLFMVIASVTKADRLLIVHTGVTHAGAAIVLAAIH